MQGGGRGVIGECDLPYNEMSEDGAGISIHQPMFGATVFTVPPPPHSGNEKHV